jgi:aspartate aminotransferase
MSEPESQKLIAGSLVALRGVAFEPEDIFMTNGGFAALIVALAAILDRDDEVIFSTPPWFFYEASILARDGVPVRVPVDPHTFDLDLDAIQAAITPRTRAVIVNSPNNPTGRIYPPESLRALGALLAERSAKYDRPIYLLSDEAYSRIIYDGRDFPSPTTYYAYSMLLYTYGKTLLAPGQRIGYIALPPSMPPADRQALRTALFMGQVITGWAFPNALLQHALPDLERLTIDVEHLQFKRDWVVRELRAMGYQVHVPEGTFYLTPRSPIGDDWAYAERLARHKILVMPGEIVEMPGYFRLSLTANDRMIERALPGLAAARAE